MFFYSSFSSLLPSSSTYSCFIILLFFFFLFLGPPTIALDASISAEEVLSAALEACEVQYGRVYYLTLLYITSHCSRVYAMTV